MIFMRLSLGGMKKVLSLLLQIKFLMSEQEYFMIRYWLPLY